MSRPKDTLSKVSLRLGKRVLTHDSSPYVIAEIGVNHQGSIDLAVDMIKSAAASGADAVKFQTYTADKLASKFAESYWDLSKEKSKNQHELFSRYRSFTPQEYVYLSEVCDQSGVSFLSTPFDIEAVDMLNPLVPFFKVASADINNFELIEKIIEKGKPIVVSTGASSEMEIDELVAFVKKRTSIGLCLLHCVLSYPTSDSDANLLMIRGLYERFPNLLLGYSDHTVANSTLDNLMFAHLLGAVVIEKHYTHDKTLQGDDHYHAMDNNDLASFTKKMTRLRSLLGSSRRREVLQNEGLSRLNARRSLVLTKDVLSGDIILDADLIMKRPGTGIEPKYKSDVIGNKVNQDLECDTILTWEMLATE